MAHVNQGTSVTATSRRCEEDQPEAPLCTNWCMNSEWRPLAKGKAGGQRHFLGVRGALRLDTKPLVSTHPDRKG